MARSMSSASMVSPQHRAPESASYCQDTMLRSFYLVFLCTCTVVGVYVNNQGQRSRKQELIWHSPPSNFGEFNQKKIIENAIFANDCVFFTAVYKEPYLLVYCESGVEVYDITSAKWIQTLPMRKVCMHTL